MEVQSLTKNARISSKKVREVTRVVQGMKAPVALETLRLLPKKAAKLIAKTLASAIANAENNNNLSSEELIIKSATATEGPKIKRFRPVARGSAHPIIKGTTHIRIILSDEKNNKI